MLPLIPLQAWLVARRGARVVRPRLEIMMELTGWKLSDVELHFEKGRLQSRRVRRHLRSRHYRDVRRREGQVA